MLVVARRRHVFVGADVAQTDLGPSGRNGARPADPAWLAACTRDCAALMLLDASSPSTRLASVMAASIALCRFTSRVYVRPLSSVTLIAMLLSSMPARLAPKLAERIDSAPVVTLAAKRVIDQQRGSAPQPALLSLRPVPARCCRASWSAPRAPDRPRWGNSLIAACAVASVAL